MQMNFKLMKSMEGSDIESTILKNDNEISIELVSEDNIKISFNKSA